MPHILSDKRNLDDLKKLLDNIETVIDRALDQHSVNDTTISKHKPVIFIDEFQAFTKLASRHGRGSDEAKAVHMLLDWLVEISKDKSKVHVILSSSEHSAHRLLFKELQSPEYFNIFDLPDLKGKEFKTTINDIDKKTARPGRPQLETKDEKRLNCIGGRIPALVEYVIANDRDKAFQTMISKHRENNEIKKNDTCPTSWFGYSTAPCYTEQQFKDVLDALDKKLNENDVESPMIDKKILMKDCKLTESALTALEEAHVVYYDFTTGLVQPQSKMQVYAWRDSKKKS